MFFFDYLFLIFLFILLYLHSIFINQFRLLFSRAELQKVAEFAKSNSKTINPSVILNLLAERYTYFQVTQGYVYFFMPSILDIHEH